MELESVGGVNVSPDALLDCWTAVEVSKWVSNNVAPLTIRTFGSRLRKVTQFSAYSCRNRRKGKLSEHAKGKAFDVAEFHLEDGRKFTVLSDWYTGTVGNFLHQIALRACNNFKLVLTPYSNKDHANHLHFDLGRWSKCEMPGRG